MTIISRTKDFWTDDIELLIASAATLLFSAKSQRLRSRKAADGPYSLASVRLGELCDFALKRKYVRNGVVIGVRPRWDH